MEDLRAKKPSSSSRLDGAGKGAPGPSVVGNLTPPRSANGLSDDILASSGLVGLVLTGSSTALLLQPSEFMDSLNDADAIFTPLVCGFWAVSCLKADFDEDMSSRCLTATQAAADYDPMVHALEQKDPFCRVPPQVPPRKDGTIPRKGYGYASRVTNG